MHQQTILKKKDGCLFASTKLGDQLLADPSKQFTDSSQKWTIICASSLQVIFVIYKLNLQVNLQSYSSSCTSAFKCSYKCSLSNCNSNSKIRILTVAFKGILKSCISLWNFRLICLL
jgi:hypothetical protein